MSKRRVEAVRNALRGTCLELPEITTSWSGELEPLSRIDPEPMHAANRRVEVVLQYGAGPVVAQRCDAHPMVTPLMAGIDKEKERHAVNAFEAIDLTMHDGVRVRIPAGAIVDANGEPVSGAVQISYRSFTEPYEIIASGIPMHVATAEGPGHFETAGMYELYASQDGVPLSLAAGSRISLERPQEQSLAADFTGWELEASTGTWVPAGTLTTTVVSPITPPLVTEATSLYWQRLWELEAEERPDTTLF